MALPQVSGVENLIIHGWCFLPSRLPKKQYSGVLPLLEWNQCLISLRSISIFSRLYSGKFKNRFHLVSKRTVENACAVASFTCFPKKAQVVRGKGEKYTFNCARVFIPTITYLIFTLPLQNHCQWVGRWSLYIVRSGFWALQMTCQQGGLSLIRRYLIGGWFQFGMKSWAELRALDNAAVVFSRWL